jgi:hypothetical protein
MREQTKEELNEIRELALKQRIKRSTSDNYLINSMIKENLYTIIDNALNKTSNSDYASQYNDEFMENDLYTAQELNKEGLISRINQKIRDTKTVPLMEALEKTTRSASLKLEYHNSLNQNNTSNKHKKINGFDNQELIKKTYEALENNMNCLKQDNKELKKDLKQQILTYLL